jgi:hypothetical protein
MSDETQSGDRGDAADRPQDPLVERLRPDPAQPPEATRTLEGVLGDSDRPGFRRLYFTPELDYYAEFRSDDIVSATDIPPDQPPFLGEQATRVTLRRDATVDYTHSHRHRPVDEFDLDVRLAAQPPLQAGAGETRFACQKAQNTFGFGVFCRETEACTLPFQCPGPTRPCAPRTADCNTIQITGCRGATCINTCRTCRTCGEATCQTCDQATCQTCETRCGQNTCNTCATHCGTCGQGTCDPFSFPTCGGCPEP